MNVAKVKTRFYCQNCGADSPKWVGKCNNCNEWNTYVEEVIKKTQNGSSKNSKSLGSEEGPVLIDEIESQQNYRIDCNDEELNRVLGGGLVPGSVVLVGGEPGIGKSTLFLQMALRIKGRTLYVSGEESKQQIKLRAQRLEAQNDECYVLVETNTSKIFKHFKKYKPDLVVIDSIQTLHSPFIESTAGSVSQIRECAGELQRFAKENQIPVIIIGHITKEGQLAGPKILEHIVDTVLQFEGDRHHVYRILRTVKNRFGSTSELGIYEMLGSGMREVSNPSELLLSEGNEELSGKCTAASMEGMRPLLIEVQALVSPSVYGNPQRTTTGFDLRRLNMLLAVLEKRCGFRMSDKDIFVNITGGIKVEDPGIDLAVCCALISSLEDKPIGRHTVFCGEVDLSGEIRSVSRLDQRIKEAEKQGFTRFYGQLKQGSKNPSKKSEIRLVSRDNLGEIFVDFIG